MERSEEIKEEFAKRRRRRWIALFLVVLLWSFLILMVNVRKQVEPESAMPIFLGSALALVAFVLWDWRCPACRRFLGRIRNPNFCPRCGVALQ
jgi:hypothetical protein